ncbi:MAG: sigma factor-like helix-turn-helix DNA-binding protein [Bacteroidota bacterium]
MNHDKEHIDPTAFQFEDFLEYVMNPDYARKAEMQAHLESHILDRILIAQLESHRAQGKTRKDILADIQTSQGRLRESIFNREVYLQALPEQALVGEFQKTGEEQIVVEMLLRGLNIFKRDFSTYIRSGSSVFQFASVFYFQLKKDLLEPRQAFDWGEDSSLARWIRHTANQHGFTLQPPAEMKASFKISRSRSIGLDWSQKKRSSPAPVPELRHVYLAIAKLSQQEKELLEFVYVQKKSYAEIASKLQLSEETVEEMYKAILHQLNS